MTPAQFISKWRDSRLRERQGSQEHFIDLCRLLDQPTPAEDDPLGERYCFERGATKAGGGDGWADVWRKGCFGWEYKGKHKDLNAALRQLQAYALDLQNPPYLIVSDMERIIVHTNWTNTVSRRIAFSLDDLHEPAQRDLLRQVLEGSDKLKPGVSPQELTAKVAARFGELGRRLQERKHDPRAVAHFLNRLVFCMFAEDARLLPEGLFTRVIRATQSRPDHARAQLEELFVKMRAGGFFGADVIKWFNGGLFDEAPVLPLEPADLKLIGDTAAEHDWSQIDPAIFGTLFEQALKATRERPALGAHYTDREKILKIVDPVIVRPLTAEWQAARSEIKAAMDAVAAADDERKAVLDQAGEAMKADPDKARAGETARRKALAAIAKARDAAYGRAKAALEAFLARLETFRVLDPACGSGNFLYVALHALRDLELRAQVDAERLGLPQQAPRVGLQCVRGIEIEPYAAELARVTLWIGDLQWLRKNGYTAYAEPILSSLDQIECRDALLNPDGTEAEWPAGDVIIGNPPFLGDKKMFRQLGRAYTDRLRRSFVGRLPGRSDFCCYWLEKARKNITLDLAYSAGLVATNSVRQSSNRAVIKNIMNDLNIFEAWSDEPWELEGAAVRVSLICFMRHNPGRTQLDGREVNAINPDLTIGKIGVDTSRAHELADNRNIAFQGIKRVGRFEIPREQAHSWLLEPQNPNGRHNSDVLRPWISGFDVIRRPRDFWIIDFGVDMPENIACQYETPFSWVASHVKPLRIGKREERANTMWWIFYWPRPDLREALKRTDSFLATPSVAKHHAFRFYNALVVPDGALVVLSRDDFTFFGLVESIYHRLWARKMQSTLEDRPAYTPSTTFETFPFPEGLTPNIPAEQYAGDPRAQGIAKAAEELNRLREAWLYPPDLVRTEPEVVPGYPDRILPRDEAAAAILKKRTLTNLYNARPAWLDMAHRRLDAAVAAAYGWPADLPDDEVLARLFALNQERAAAGR
jgi:type II restriction/modification system DNA methylase subunit YeeA